MRSLRTGDCFCSRRFFKLMIRGTVFSMKAFFWTWGQEQQSDAFSLCTAGMYVAAESRKVLMGRAPTCDTTFFCTACRTALVMAATFSSSGSSLPAPPAGAENACSFNSLRLNTLKVSDKISAPSASRGSSSSAKHAGIETKKGKPFTKRSNSLA